jgi:glycosyltransferase involved in cell wall biosynthesis
MSVLGTSGRHIALLMPNFGGGGAERAMITLANSFAAMGHRVDFLVLEATGPFAPLLRSDIRVVELRRRSIFAAILVLVRYLRSEQPAALLSTLDHANVGAILASTIARTGTRIVIRLATTLSSARVTAATRRKRIMLDISRIVYRFADRVVAVSQGVADDAVRFARLSPVRVLTIRNPMDFAEIERLADQLPNTDGLGALDAPFILAVGRLGPEKDFATLIKAFASIRAERDLRLVILGEGQERPLLSALTTELQVQTSISMPGFAANPFAYMRRASAFVLSSIHEGYPNVLCEAMACGCPVVSTDCPSGPREILQNGRYGRLVPIGDVNQMAAAIVQTLDAPMIPDSLRQRARELGAADSVNRYIEALLGP